MALGTRTVRRRRTVKIDDSAYRVGRKATRTAVKEGGVKTVTLAKKAGGTITKTLTKSDDAKNLRIGAYARAHKTREGNAVTYQKKAGGTVTKTLSVDGAKAKRKRPNMQHQ